MTCLIWHDQNQPPPEHTKLLAENDRGSVTAAVYSEGSWFSEFWLPIEVSRWAFWPEPTEVISVPSVGIEPTTKRL